MRVYTPASNVVGIPNRPEALLRKRVLGIKPACGMKVVLAMLFSLSIISCNKKVEQNEKQESIPNSVSIARHQNNDTRIRVRFDTIPTNAFLIMDDAYFDFTPVSLYLEKRDRVIRFERLRYYPEEIHITLDQLKENPGAIISLKENAAFTKEHYLSYQSDNQGDGIQKRFYRYIYDENAQLIRIDKYVQIEKTGFYDVTTNDKGQILTRQFYSGDKTNAWPVEYFEYDENDLLIKSYYDSDEVKWDCEYFYRDGLLERKIAVSKSETFVFDYIVEVEYGSKDSGYTKKVTEKYFYSGMTDDEKKEALENDSLPRTIYVYQ